ncbi:MAG: formate dehydrogenase accessory protein FdhE [Coriobacteriia bacterium]|nr:formate dehydrogenase accessory protein FdhE [Coriobacteriia bacterium]
MSSVKSIDEIRQFREVLGDEPIELFTNLWTLQDSIADSDLLDGLRSTITFLEKYHPGLREATGPLFEQDFTLEQIDPITAIGVEELFNELAKSCEIDIEDEMAPPLALAVVSAIQPHAAAAAKAIKPPKKTDQKIGACPVCGGPASLGIIRNEGQAHGGSRELWCSLCDYTWPYPRIKCARCGNEKQRELQYFFVEEDPSRRVYVCNECNGTLKVVDETGLGRFCDPRVEDIVIEPLLNAIIADQGLETVG